MPVACNQIALLRNFLKFHYITSFALFLFHFLTILLLLGILLLAHYSWYVLWEIFRYLPIFWNLRHLNPICFLLYRFIQSLHMPEIRTIHYFLWNKISSVVTKPADYCFLSIEPRRLFLWFLPTVLLKMDVQITRYYLFLRIFHYRHIFWRFLFSVKKYSILKSLVLK